MCLYCFFFNDTATTEIYTLSLHDALPIWIDGGQFLEDHGGVQARQLQAARVLGRVQAAKAQFARLGDGLAREDGFTVPVRGMGRGFGLGKGPDRKSVV